MIIQKLMLCLSDIEAFVDRLCQLIVSDSENGVQDSAKHVVWLFEVSLKVGFCKGF